MVPVSSGSESRTLRKFLEGLEGSGIPWKVPTWAAPLPMGLAFGGKAAQGPGPLLVGEGLQLGVLPQVGKGGLPPI